MLSHFNKIRFILYFFLKTLFYDKTGKKYKKKLLTIGISYLIFSFFLSYYSFYKYNINSYILIIYISGLLLQVFTFLSNIDSLFLTDDEYNLFSIYPTDISFFIMGKGLANVLYMITINLLYLVLPLIFIFSHTNNFISIIAFIFYSIVMVILTNFLLISFLFLVLKALTKIRIKTIVSTGQIFFILIIMILFQVLAWQTTGNSLKTGNENIILGFLRDDFFNFLIQSFISGTPNKIFLINLLLFFSCIILFFIAIIFLVSMTKQYIFNLQKYSYKKYSSPVEKGKIWIYLVKLFRISKPTIAGFQFFKIILRRDKLTFIRILPGLMIVLINILLSIITYSTFNPFEHGLLNERSSSFIIQESSILLLAIFIDSAVTSSSFPEKSWIFEIFGCKISDLLDGFLFVFRFYLILPVLFLFFLIYAINFNIIHSMLCTLFLFISFDQASNIISYTDYHSPLSKKIVRFDISYLLKKMLVIFITICLMFTLFQITYHSIILFIATNFIVLGLSHLFKKNRIKRYQSHIEYERLGLKLN